MYNVISKQEFSLETFLDTILDNRGIADKQSFLNPTKDSLIHYSKLKDIDKAVEMFDEVKSNNKKIAILSDEDLDGANSSTALGKHIESNFPNLDIRYFQHFAKKHGLYPEMTSKILKSHKQDEFDLLFIPDAGSNDKNELIKLIEKGIKVIILDHHLLESNSQLEHENVVLVNPMYSPDYHNKDLSGCAVVYKYLQALDDFYGLNEADNYLDLVGLSLVSDAIKLVHPETRYLLKVGLSYIQNEFWTEIIEKNVGTTKGIYPQTLSFSVFPKANSLIRVGKKDEQEDFLKALLGRQEIFYNTRTKKEETLPQKVARICNNTYNKQKKERESYLEIINEKIKEEGLLNNSFLLIMLHDNKFNKALTGYLAGNLTSYNKPVLLGIWDEKKKHYTGSLRGVATIPNTKSLLEKTGLFEFLIGHEQACGFAITKENLDKLNEVVNTQLNFSKADKPKIDVDFYIPIEELNEDIIKGVYEYEYLWGQGVHAPTFATTVKIETSWITQSKSSSMIKWWTKGVDFVQFSGSKELVELIDEDNPKELELEIVGQVGMSSFMGKVTPQFRIDDIEILSVSDINRSEKLDDIFDW